MSRSNNNKSPNRGIEKTAPVPKAVPELVPKRVFAPAPDPEIEAGFRKRREQPLNTSTLPPLDWMSALDKYCPINNKIQ